MQRFARRGHKYEFLEKDGTTKKTCLVVSSDSRKASKIISILMIGNKENSDSVCVGNGEYVNCGLVTYCMRDRLGDEVGVALPETMNEIETVLCRSLGITDYREIYYDLLREVRNDHS